MELFSTNKAQPLIILDPRTKLYLLIVFSLTTFAANPGGLVGWLKLGMAFFAFLMLLNIKKPIAAVLYALLYLAAYRAEWLFGHISAASIPGLFIRMFIPIVLRMLPTLVAAYSMLRTTRVGEFIAAMERMRIPQQIIIPFAVLFRFFPTLREEYRSIQDAMKMRGIGFRKGPVALLEYRMVPLIVSIVRMGDELSAAAITRGLGGDGKRTSYCKIGFGAMDVFLFAFMSAVLITFIVFRGLG